jgi:hypothetical protein
VIQPLHDHLLDDPSYDRHSEEDQRQGHQHVDACVGLQRPGCVSAEHHEFAMREIDDPHRAVDDGKTEGDHQKD